MAYGDGKYFGALQQPTIGLKNYSVGSQSGAANILEVGSNPIFPSREYSSMGFPRIKTINPYSAPMRLYRYTIHSGPIRVRGWRPQSSNYVYHATPNYNYRKAYYKYPQYRKWDSKLQESLKHGQTTDFSDIPRRKIDNIYYQLDKYTVPTGVITGTTGSLISIYNNMDTYNRNNPYYYRYTNQYYGN